MLGLMMMTGNEGYTEGGLFLVGMTEELNREI